MKSRDWRSFILRCVIAFVVLLSVLQILNIFQHFQNYSSKLKDTSQYLLSQEHLLEITRFKTGKTFKNVTMSTDKSLEIVHNTERKDENKCKLDTRALHGREKVNETVYNFSILESMFGESEMGGRFKPKNCTSKIRIAVILPFRDRESHLKVYLLNVLPKLQRQNADFTIYVVEQATGSKFNRGMMRNIGFVEARKIYPYDCYIFNDVDSIPENDRNIFKCGTDGIRHLVTGVDRYKYKLKYSTLVGGIIAFTEEQFRKVNGYSNFYFDWGAEDDDIYDRITRTKVKIERPDSAVGDISTLKHVRDPEVKSRFRILWSRDAESSRKDGINSLKYKVKLIERKKLYTWIYVSIDQKEVLKDLNVKSKYRKKG